MPVTEYPGQRFVFEKKFSIEVEKGSLEEKYQHLLQPDNADEDDEKDGVVSFDLSGEFMQINDTFVRVDQVSTELPKVSTETSDNFQSLNFSKKLDQSNYGYNYNPQDFYPYYNSENSYQSGQPNFQGYQMSNQRYHNLQYQQNQMNKFKQQLPQQNLHQQQPHRNHKMQEHQLQQQQHQDQLQFQVHQKQQHQQQQFQPQQLYYQQNQDMHLHHQQLHEQQSQGQQKLQYHNQQQQQFQHQRPQQYQLQHQYNEQQHHDKQSQQHQSRYQEPKWNQQQQYDNSYSQSYNYYNPYYYYSFNPNLNYHLNRNNQSYYIRQFIGTTTRKPIDERYELLPKSYLSLGAKIQHVIVNRDDDGNKVKIPNADEDSLEVLAPFDPFEDEIITINTTSSTSTITTTTTTEMTSTQSIHFDDDNEFITEILMNEEIVKLKAKLFQDFFLSKNYSTKSNTTKNLRRTTRIPMRKFRKSNLGRKISDQKMNEMKQEINEKRIQIIKIQKTNRRFNANSNWRNYALHTPSIRKHIGTATTQRVTKLTTPTTLTTTITTDTKPTTTRKRIILQEKPMRSRGKRPKFLQIKSFPLTNQDQINILSVRKPLDFCSKPVYLKHDCQPKILVKIWSYNKRDKRCYQYEDECAHLKENAFTTSMECFYNCWSP